MGFLIGILAGIFVWWFSGYLAIRLMWELDGRGNKDEQHEALLECWLGFILWVALSINAVWFVSKMGLGVGLPSSIKNKLFPIEKNWRDEYEQTFRGRVH